MDKRKGIIRILGAVAVLSLLAAACGGGDEDGQATPATEAPDGVTEGAPEAAPGFDGSAIKVGILVPLTGTAAIIGKPLAAGQETYWKALNDEDGVAGRYRVEVRIEDTLYDQNTTVQQYNKIKNDVVLFSQVMGTPHNQALLPLLEDDGIVVAPASQDAMWVREQNLLPIIEPYQIDVINGMAYWMDQPQAAGAKVCAVAQSDVYGEAGLEGLEYAAGAMGFDVATVARFKMGDQDFTAQVSQLKAQDCDLVWAVALPVEFGGLLGKSAELGFAPQWIAQSPAWIDELAGTPLKGYLEEHVWIAATGYEWGDVSVPGVATLMEKLAKYAPDQEPDYYFTFGYYQAMAVHQLLERAVERGDLSRDGILAAMNSLEALHFDDLIGDYGYGAPQDRNPSRQSTVFKVNAAKPFALEALEANFTTDFATQFEFPAGD